MNEETMRLSAELSLAKFSPQAKQMVKDLAEIKAATDKAHDPATKVAKLHAKAYDELRQKIGGTAETIRGVLSPAMAALGITGFGVGEALGKVISGLKDAANNYHIMNDASKRSGLSVDELNAVGITFQRLGQDIRTATEGAANFGEVMGRLDRNTPQERLRWAGAYADIMPQLLNEMHGKSRIEQQALLLKFNQRKDVPIDTKRRIDQMFGVDPSIASKTKEEDDSAIAYGRAFAKKYPDNPILNGALQKAFADLTESTQGFQWQMNETFGGPGITVINAFASSIRAIGKDFKDLHDLIIGKPNEDSNWLPKSGNWLNPKIYDFLHNPLGTKPNAESDSFSKALKDAGGGFQPMSYGGSQAEGMLATGVKVGMLAAFREWFSSLQGGGGGGFQNASYGPNGTGSTKSAADIARGFGSNEFPNVTGGGRGAPGGGGPNGVDIGAAPNGGGSNSGRTAISKVAAMEQLRREGVPEEHVEAAASLLVGQAIAESNLNPNTVHDGGTGYGIYGAGRERRTKMLNWLSANGFAKNSLEGQMKYMAHEAMSRSYGPTRAALMNADPNNFPSGARVLTHNFESPRIENWQTRLGNTRDAHRTNVNERNLLANKPPPVLGGGGGTQKIEGDAKLAVTLNGFPKGTGADLSYGGMFKEHTLTRGFQMQPATRE